MRFPLLLLLSCAVALQSQTLTYTRLSAEGPAPAPRIDGAIVYDPVGRQVFLFGGQEGAAKNDLWAYSLDRRQWTEVQTGDPRPPARFGHTVVFDAVRRWLVVFGGQAGGFFSDTWAFDIGRGAWEQLSRDGAGPSRRYGHSAIYDTARDRMIISHGFTNAGRFDDTWAFDLAGNTWRDISPSSNRPLRRCLHHAAYDRAGNQMLLYGGCASGFGPCPLDDLWALDLNSNRWTERAAAVKPPARQWFGIGFDGKRSRLLIFGGSGGGGLLDDTWEYDTAAGLWRRPAVSGAAPGARERHEATSGGDQGAIFFFGGRTNAGLSNELWMLATAEGRPRITAGDVNAFSFQRDAVAPGEIVSIFGVGLGPAAGVAASFDAGSGQLPTSLGGVTVTWNGTASPLYFARSDQLNVQTPYELAGAREAELVVTYAGAPSAPQSVAVVPARPGLFPGVFNQNGSPNTPENPASIGSIVVLFATGQGVTDPPSPSGAYPKDSFPMPAAPVTLRIGGRPAELLFRGQAPGTAGVMQINARIPEGVTPGNAVPVILEIGAGQSQPGVNIAVR